MGLPTRTPIRCGPSFCKSVGEGSYLVLVTTGASARSSSFVPVGGCHAAPMGDVGPRGRRGCRSEMLRIKCRPNGSDPRTPGLLDTPWRCQGSRGRRPPTSTPSSVRQGTFPGRDGPSREFCYRESSGPPRSRPRRRSGSWTVDRPRSTCRPSQKSPFYTVPKVVLYCFVT